MNRFAVWLAAMTIVAACTLPAVSRAARLIHLEVELDGQIVLEGIATDSGHESADFVWLYLHSTALEPAGGFTMPEAAGQPPQSTIKGKIKIRVKHADRILAESTTDSLALRPYPNQTSGWQVMPDEVARTAKLAGLALPQGQAMTGPGVIIGALLDRPFILLTVGAVVLLVIAIVLCVLLGTKRNQGRAQN